MDSRARMMVKLCVQECSELDSVGDQSLALKTVIDTISTNVATAEEDANSSNDMRTNISIMRKQFAPVPDSRHRAKSLSLDPILMPHTSKKNPERANGNILQPVYIRMRQSILRNSFEEQKTSVQSWYDKPIGQNDDKSFKKLYTRDSSEENKNLNLKRIRERYQKPHQRSTRRHKADDRLQSEQESKELQTYSNEANKLLQQPFRENAELWSYQRPFKETSKPHLFQEPLKGSHESHSFQSVFKETDYPHSYQSPVKKTLKKSHSLQKPVKAIEDPPLFQRPFKESEEPGSFQRPLRELDEPRLFHRPFKNIDETERMSSPQTRFLKKDSPDKQWNHKEYNNHKTSFEKLKYSTWSSAEKQTERVQTRYKDNKDMRVLNKPKNREETLSKLKAPRSRIGLHRPQKRPLFTRGARVTVKNHNMNTNTISNRIQGRSDRNKLIMTTRFSKQALAGLSPQIAPYNFKKHLKSIVNEFPRANITCESLGKTVSFNDIVLMKITEKHPKEPKYRETNTKYEDDEPQKKIIFIVHGLSAMGLDEIDCLSNIEDLKELLGYYLKYLHVFEFFVIPIANPDGLMAIKRDKLWNKNLSPQSHCPGVALDRNFEVGWNVSRNITSCSQQYPGPRPFSEIETQAIKKVFHRYGHKIFGYFHVHASTFTRDFFKGDAVLFPKGYTENSEDDKYSDLKGEIDDAVLKAGFQTVSVAVESLYNWYGQVAGTSVDYASAIFGIPYAMELVMQIYTHESDLQNMALTKLWKKVLKVIFCAMEKKMKGLETI